MKKHINLVILLFLILDILIVYLTFFAFKEKTTKVRFDEGLISNIKVEYEVIGNPFASVDIIDISDTTELINSTVSKVGNSFDISSNFSNNQLKKAKITIEYDKEKLPEDTNEDNLAVLWYDEENNKMVKMKTKVDSEKETLTFTTNHFSEYIIVDILEWENAWNQEVAKIREKDAKFSLEFIVDDSGSMTTNDPNNNRLISTQASINSLSEDDEYLIMKFDGYNEILQDFTSDNSLATSALEEFDSSGDTNIVSAVENGLEAFEDVSSKRQKIILLLTDGEDSYLSSKVDELTEKANEQDVTIFTIGLRATTDAKLDFSVIEKLAEETNGKFYDIDGSELENIFSDITNATVGVDGELDTDDDGIPDGIETAGMRDQFGNIIKTNPYLEDSDGDGLSDRYEMGEQAKDDNGNIYYLRISDPLTNEKLNQSTYHLGPNDNAIESWDSGFRSNVNGFSFSNFTLKFSDGSKQSGVCAGFAYIAENVYNGTYKIQDGNYGVCLPTSYFKTLVNSRNLFSYKLNFENFDGINEKTYDVANDSTNNIHDRELLYELYYEWALANDYTIGEVDINFDVVLDALGTGVKNIYNKDFGSISSDFIEDFQNKFNAGKIVTIDLAGKLEKDDGSNDYTGHSINAYALEKCDNSGNTYKLYVYDNNFPYREDNVIRDNQNGNTYILLTKTWNGKYNFLYAPIGDDDKSYRWCSGLSSGVFSSITVSYNGNAIVHPW